MERRVETGWLLDFYGPLLTPRQRTLLRMHYDEDLSLAEIASQEGISRQGVHDAVRRGEAQLHTLEDRLGLLARYQNAYDALAACHEALKNVKPVKGSEAALQAIQARLSSMLAEEEGLDGL